MEKNNVVYGIFNKYSEFIKNHINVFFVSLYNCRDLSKYKKSLQKNNDLSGLVILDAPDLFDKGYSFDNARKHIGFSQVQIEKFAKKMEENISKDNLINMYNHLHSLLVIPANLNLLLLSSIYRIKHRLKKGTIGGFFLNSSNCLVVLTPLGINLTNLFSKSDNSITLDGIYSHELLHMCSSYKGPRKQCSGFCHAYIGFYFHFLIGNSLNEGYTDLLNERIFGEINEGGPYEIYIIISEMIENVIGKDKMMNYYFSADLNGLLSDLSKYVSLSDAKKFIVDLDLFMDNTSKFSEVVDTLLNIYKNKLNDDVKNDVKTEEEFVFQLEYLKLNIIKIEKLYKDWLGKNNKSYESELNIDSSIEEIKNHL